MCVHVCQLFMVKLMRLATLSVHFIKPLTDSFVSSIVHTLMHAALHHAVPEVDSFIEAVKKHAEHEAKSPEGKAVEQRW